MREYTIRLWGAGTADKGLPGRILRHLLDTVDDGSRGAVRLRLEGRSTAGGIVPAWLETASAFDVVDFLDADSGIRVRAPTLRDALPGRFEQADLFPVVDPNKSAIALLAEGLEDAAQGKVDSDSYDEGLLGVFERLSGLFNRGVEGIEITNQRKEATVVVESSSLETIQRLRQSTPQPRRARIVGHIDAISYSDRGFTLVLEDGRKVRGVLVDGSPKVLAQLFGRLAVVSGLVHYRPSGAVLRVDAERLAPATEADAVAWSEVPKPLDAPLDSRAVRRSQGPRSGLSKIFGKWPGNETDEEIERMLAELS